MAPASPRVSQMLYPLVNLVPRVGKYIWTVKLAPGSPAVLAVLAMLPLRATSKQGNGAAGNLIATVVARAVVVVQEYVTVTDPPTSTETKT
uniref:Uncharacterized protein n=1 Tax=Florenciella parvula TaxID=236787 RepID=A0A7S2GCJ4_9STRA